MSTLLFPFFLCYSLALTRNKERQKEYIRLDFALCTCQPLVWHVSSDEVVGQQGHRSMRPICFTSTLGKRLLDLQLVSCCLFDVEHHIHQPLGERLLLRKNLEVKGKESILQAKPFFETPKNNLSNKLTSDLLFCFFFLFVTFGVDGVLFCHLILDILR